MIIVVVVNDDDESHRRPVGGAVIGPLLPPLSRPSYPRRHDAGRGGGRGGSLRHEQRR